MVMNRLEQAVVNLDIRPIRLAYLVRQGSRSDFRAAALEATSRWGGIQEFIVPVRRNGQIDKIWQQLLRLFPVDYFCATFAAPVSLTSSLQGSYDIQVLDLAQVQSRWYGIHALGAYRAERASGLEIVAAANSRDVLNLAALGGFTDETHHEAWASRGAVVRLSPESVNTVAAQLSGATLIGASGYQCGETLLRGLAGGPVLLWIAKPNSLPDALDFWNTRALSPLRLAPMKTCVITPTLPADSRLRAPIVAAVLASSRPMAPDVLLFSKTVPVQERETIAAQLGLEMFTGNRPEYDPLPGGRPAGRALSGRATWDPFNFVFREREPGQRATVLTLIQPDETIVRVGSPVEFSSSIGGAVRARFSGPTQFKLPPGKSIGRLFHDLAIVHQGAVEIQTDTNVQYEFRLRVPLASDLLTASLGDKGIAFELSDKGRLASGALNLTRDIQVFRGENALRVIEALTTHRFAYELREARSQLKKSDEELEALAARLQEVRQLARSAEQIASEIGRRYGSTRAADIVPVLGDLVDKGLVRRGLMVSCNLCRFPSFVELDGVRSPMICPACGSVAKFVSGPGGEPTLHYRLNALLDRASDNGVMGHLVGVAALQRENSSAFVLPGVNLSLPGLGKREVDLLCLVEGEIGIGEAKTSAELFDEGQLKRDLATARAIGAVVYVLVCIEQLASPFKNTVQQKCAAAGIRPLLVEGAAGQLARLA
jgi:hypothetical protein